MARRAASLTESVAAALKPVIDRIVARVAEHVATRVANRVGVELANAGERRRRRRGQNRASPVLTRWVAGRRARRVPTFVIEMTGLDTKK